MSLLVLMEGVLLKVNAEFSIVRESAVNVCVCVCVCLCVNVFS